MIYVPRVCAEAGCKVIAYQDLERGLGTRVEHGDQARTFSLFDVGDDLLRTASNAGLDFAMANIVRGWLSEAHELQAKVTAVTKP